MEVLPPVTMATSGLRDPLWRDPGFDLGIFYLPAERGTRQPAAAKLLARTPLHGFFENTRILGSKPTCIEMLPPKKKKRNTHLSTENEYSSLVLVPGSCYLLVRRRGLFCVATIYTHTLTNINNMTTNFEPLHSIMMMNSELQPQNQPRKYERRRSVVVFPGTIKNELPDYSVCVFLGERTHHENLAR